MQYNVPCRTAFPREKRPRSKRVRFTHQTKLISVATETDKFASRQRQTIVFASDLQIDRCWQRQNKLVCVVMGSDAP